MWLGSYTLVQHQGLAAKASHRGLIHFPLGKSRRVKSPVARSQKLKFGLDNKILQSLTLKKLLAYTIVLY